MFFFDLCLLSYFKTIFYKIILEIPDILAYKHLVEPKGFIAVADVSNSLCLNL